MVKKRILIVDDEVSLSQILRLNLEQSGDYEVAVANSGTEGLEAALTFKPDLVLLDLMMPDMDGTDVAARLEEDPRTRDIAIVFVTAVAQREEVGAGGAMIGGRAVLAKPVEASEVIDMIQRQLARRPSPHR